MSWLLGTCTMHHWYSTVSCPVVHKSYITGTVLCHGVWYINHTSLVLYCVMAVGYMHHTSTTGTVLWHGFWYIHHTSLVLYCVMAVGCMHHTTITGTVLCHGFWYIHHTSLVTAQYCVNLMDFGYKYLTPLHVTELCHGC